MSIDRSEWSLKRLAWAYGCSRADDECEELRAALVERVLREDGVARELADALVAKHILRTAGAKGISCESTSASMRCSTARSPWCRSRNRRPRTGLART